MCFQAEGACLVSELGHMLSICVCGLAEGRPLGQMLRQCSRESCRFCFFRSAIFPPSIRPVGPRPAGEVKQWTAALNRNSSPERQLDPVRPCKSLQSFSARRSRVHRKKGKQRSHWHRLVKFGPKKVSKK